MTTSRLAIERLIGVLVPLVGCVGVLLLSAAQTNAAAYRYDPPSASPSASTTSLARLPLNKASADAWSPRSSAMGSAARRSFSAAEAGPGAWADVSESMSGRAAAYQAQIAGRAGVYEVDGVKFDGFANGALQEAKGPGYATFVRNGQFVPWFRGADALAGQAERQVAAAGGTPIDWSVAEPSAATAIRNLFAERGISGIGVSYVPPGP